MAVMASAPPTGRSFGSSLTANMRATRFCAWAGIVASGFWVLGFMIISGMVPPPSPLNTARQTAEIFADHAMRIRVGLVLTCIGGAMIGLWVAGISVFLKRIEGRDTPLTYAQLALGCLLPLEFIVPVFTWQVAAYRPERPAEIVQMLNDMAWMPFIGAVYTAVFEAIAIAYAVLRERPGGFQVFPRWVAYLNLFFLATFCPGTMLVFFKDGPFAWNGVMAFWVVVVGYFSWTIFMSVVMIQASRRLEAAAGDEDTALERDDVRALAAEVAALRQELRSERALKAETPPAP